jgi:predicted ATPase
MVQGLLQHEDIPVELLTMIRQRADGNPFYIEAIVRDLLENGVIDVQQGQPVRVLKDLDSVAIPDTIQGMVVSQIDRLRPDLKDTLQAAAVIGPVFKLELLKRITADPAAEEKLSLLTAMDMVFESKAFPEVEYSFKNMLIQEAAYGCLLLKRQRELHAQIAAAMASMYQDRLEDYYERLAFHYQYAQDTGNAYRYAVKSGLKAKKIFANQNAVEHFQQALALSEAVADPEPPPADVHIWMSEVHELTGALDAAIDARQRAIDLLGDELQKADSQRNIGRILEKQGKKEEALAVYEQVHAILERYPDSLEMARLLMNESWVLNRMRQHDEAIRKCMRALELFETHQETEDIAQAHNNLAVFHESRRELDLALQHNLRSMNLFRTLGNKRKLANTFLSLGYVYDKRNERTTALDYFESAIVTMEKIGNRYGAGTALMAKGRCYMDMGQLDDAESVLLRALRIHKDLNLNLKIIANDLALARVCMGKDQFSDTRSYLQDARAIAEADDNRSDLAKIAHAEAQLLVREGTDPQPKFEEAITLFEELGRRRDADRVRADMEAYKITA